jgi:ectoine hydroxylase-related dioxygenase (phytanoyl-CoA dioxygenase family)
MAIDVDLQKFRQDGYLILKNVVAPEQLDELRLTVELMVDREKARSVAQRKNDEPRGGAWYQNAQPRLTLDSIDAETAAIIDFCLGETTFGVSQQLMQAPATTLTSFGALCSGLIDYGHTDWHRDASSAEQAPLSGMQFDLMENKPGYVQWNIALYEDDVFWVLPGSHKQPTNEAQRRQLMLNPKAQLEGSVPAKLEPGDGIVYPNLMMHWGSSYTSRLRRTIHLGYRTFGADIFSYHHHLDWYHEDGFLQYVSAAARAHFDRSAAFYEEEMELAAAALHAVVNHDEQGFRTHLARLHPGATGRMVCVVLLCRIANKIVTLHKPDIAQMSVEARKPLIDGSPPACYSENMAQRFTAEQAVVMEQRLAKINEGLQQDADLVHQRYTEIYAELKPDAAASPNFESRPLRTFNSEMPKGFGVDEFVSSWDG